MPKPKAKGTSKRRKKVAPGTQPSLLQSLPQMITKCMSFWDDLLKSVESAKAELEAAILRDSDLLKKVEKVTVKASSLMDLAAAVAQKKAQVGEDPKIVEERLQENKALLFDLTQFRDALSAAIKYAKGESPVANSGHESAEVAFLKQLYAGLLKILRFEDLGELNEKSLRIILDRIGENAETFVTRLHLLGLVLKDDKIIEQGYHKAERRALELAMALGVISKDYHHEMLLAKDFRELVVVVLKDEFLADRSAKSNQVPAVIANAIKGIRDDEEVAATEQEVAEIIKKLRRDRKV